MSNLSQFSPGSIQPNSNITIDILCANRISICKPGQVFILEQFTGEVNDPGCYLSGGHVICKSAGTAWVVAPRCSEVSRQWDARDNAVVLAETCTGVFGGWFVPTMTQLQNPGYTCRTFWDSFSTTRYWSSSEHTATPGGSACEFNMCTGSLGFPTPKTNTYCVRAFRCVTY
jgi:hypothetical protein